MVWFGPCEEGREKREGEEGGKRGGRKGRGRGEEGEEGEERVGKNEVGEEGMLMEAHSGQLLVLQVCACVE